MYRKIMNIVFVGLGSIGQRHLQNIQKIYENKNINFYSLKRSSNKKVIKNGKVLSKSDIINYYKIKLIYDVKEITSIRPDIIIISNPSSLHLDTTLKLLKYSNNFFIEKPLGDDRKKITHLLKISQEKRKYIFIGLQTRFHPMIKFLKKIIETKLHGEIITSKLEFLTYLPNHHKYEDYRNSYAANKKLGGSAIANLVHEVDLINYLFGHPNKILSFDKKTNILESDIKDYFSSKLIYKNKFDINLALSMSEINEKRSVLIKFQKKTIICDLNKNKLTIYDNKTGKKIIKNFKLKRNDLFLDEMKYFLKQTTLNNKSYFLTLKDYISTQNLYFKLIGKKMVKF